MNSGHGKETQLREPNVLISMWVQHSLRDSSRVLLDAETSTERPDAIRSAIEADAGNRVADMHIRRVGPHHFAAIVSVVRPRTPQACALQGAVPRT
jgi:Co/Zn/Cd efflux system component